MLMNANESLPENTSESSAESTKKAFRGGQSKATDTNEVAIIKRNEAVKANDPELQLRMTKHSIANFTKDNDFFDKIGISSIDENESVCNFFKRFNDKITSWEEKDRKELNQLIIDSYEKLDETNKAFNSLMLPRQIMLGMMLNALNRAGEDIDKFSRKLNLAQRTCYNYMNAANIVPYIERDCVYNLGMMVLAGLGKYFKDNEKNKKENETSFHEFIINYMDSPLELKEENEVEFDKEYNRRVAYVYYRHGFFEDYPIGDEEYGHLFKANYEWTYREANRIKESTLAPKEEGSKKRKINDKDGVNKGIRKLVEDLSGDKDVYKKRRSIDISCKNGVKALTSIIDKFSDFEDLSEENRGNLEILRNQLQKCQQKLDSLLNKNPEE